MSIESTWLFRSSSIIPVVFARILIGFLAFCDFLGHYIGYYWMKKAIVPGMFHFKYYGFEWVRIPPEPFWTLIFVVGGIAGLAVMLGYRYRQSIFILFLCFSYVFFAEKALYLNHGYLFVMILFWMNFVPANRWFSLDVKNGKVEAKSRVPKIYKLLFCFLMGLVYFYGGIAKFNPDWTRAVPMLKWLQYKSDYFLIGPLISQDWFAWFLSYGGLFFDTFIVFFLIIPATRKYAIFMAIFFHVTNTMIFQIGIFPWLSIGLTLLFMSDKWFDNIYDRWQKRWGWRALNKEMILPPYAHLLKYSLIAYVVVMLLVPFRHHLYEGRVAWTEEGHRCSWRMMLRSKSGYGHFVVKNDQGLNKKVYPKDYISARQRRSMFTRPDMILEFAHFLSKEFETEEGPAEVYADIKVKLNDYPSQVYIDRKVNLAEVEWSPWKRSTWIMEFKGSINN